MGGGPPRFPPDSACRAVLTQSPHARPDAVAYGTLTPSGGPFQRPSADAQILLQRARPPPSSPGDPSNPRTTSPAGSAAARVWAPPRSLAATRGILSLPRGTEMFQFPRCPPAYTGALPSRKAGCPIRTPPDRRLPAPPRGVSPRGRVLPRPTTPRHPPCARLRDHSCVTNASPSHQEVSEARPTRARGTKVPHTAPSALAARARSFNMVMCGARGRGSASASPRPRPRGLGGLTHQVVKVRLARAAFRANSEADRRAEDGASAHLRGRPAHLGGISPQTKPCGSVLRIPPRPIRRPCRLLLPRSRRGGPRGWCPPRTPQQAPARPGLAHATLPRDRGPSLERR